MKPEEKGTRQRCILADRQTGHQVTGNRANGPTGKRANRQRANRL